MVPIGDPDHPPPPLPPPPSNPPPPATEALAAAGSEAGAARGVAPEVSKPLGIDPNVGGGEGGLRLAVAGGFLLGLGASTLAFAMWVRTSPSSQRWARARLSSDVMATTTLTSPGREMLSTDSRDPGAESPHGEAMADGFELNEAAKSARAAENRAVDDVI